MSKDDELMSLDDEGEVMVPAVLARSMVEAEVYCELLGDHDIPAVIGDDLCAEDSGEDDADEGEDAMPPAGRMTHGVPVLVPEVLLDDAGVVIAQQDDLDEMDVVEDAIPDDDDDKFGFSEFEEGDADDPEDEDLPFGDEDDEM